ncbi:MAG: hypothetical protein ATN34_00295 [Epulopiscium sp. Nele67-Bin002]|nr:MAG: hypothetical protein ATN34_00295 [Epulopiscium sp. Nele67-Bin002]OOO00300.1 MAG: hypothetical protein ATN35_07995 [Epulopiscium sp. Nele67-Bin004]
MENEEIIEKLHQTINNTDTILLKNVVRTFQQMFDDDKYLQDLFGITKKQIEKLGHRESIKLDEILKSLFTASPRMYLGTIDKLYDTNYLEQYISGELTDADIHLSQTDFIRETLGFELLKADLIIIIKGMAYHIEFQTRHDEMAIRFARYGVEYGIQNKEFNPESGAYKIPIPEQSVIYLENNTQKDRVNKYEFWWKNQSLGVVEVKQLKLWQTNIDNVIDEKLYNLLPVLIFKHRKELLKVNGDKDKLTQIKDNFLSDARSLMEHAQNEISSHIQEEDMDLIVIVMGEMIRYFDKVFFDGSIESRGEIDMTFSEQIKDFRQEITGYRQEITGYREEITGYKQTINEDKHKISQQQQEIIHLQTELSDAEIKGKIKVFQEYFNYSIEQISDALKIPIEQIEEMIK